MHHAQVLPLVLLKVNSDITFPILSMPSSYTAENITAANSDTATNAYRHMVVIIIHYSYVSTKNKHLSDDLSVMIRYTS